VEVRKTEVLSAMQQMLSEAVLLEKQAKQGGQVSKYSNLRSKISINSL